MIVKGMRALRHRHGAPRRLVIGPSFFDRVKIHSGRDKKFTKGQWRGLLKDLISDAWIVSKLFDRFEAPERWKGTGQGEEPFAGGQVGGDGARSRS